MTATTTHASYALPQQRPALDGLRARLAGPLLEPQQEGYEELVAAWNLAVPMRPAAVVGAVSAQDVVETVRYARAHGLTVGVQATGHGAVAALAGHLLVRTSALDELTVHPEGWARVGAGVKWGRVVEAAAPYGLAPLNGSSTDVGVVGYTTGGGVGPMARTYGLAADRVRAFEVVTGDGELRRVTPTEHPDLFFALRGGKGAGGIITAVELDLVRQPTFFGGAVYFDGPDASRVMERWRSWSAELPEAGTTSIALFQLPPLPMVPPVLAGRLTVAVRLLWTGDEAEGARWADRLRSVAEPLLDDWTVRPYAAVDAVHTDPVDPLPVAEASRVLRAFPAEAAERLLAVAGAGSGSPQVLLEVRQLGGALSREGAHPTAFDHRGAAYNLFMVGIAEDPSVVPHAERVLAAMAPWETGGVLPNYGPPQDAETAARAYAPETLRRLAEVVRAYDPDGVLAGGAFTRQG